MKYLLLTILFVSCGVSESKEPKVKLNVDWIQTTSNSELYEYSLEDGSRVCVIGRSRAAAIPCEFYDKAKELSRK